MQDLLQEGVVNMERDFHLPPPFLGSPHSTNIIKKVCSKDLEVSYHPVPDLPLVINIDDDDDEEDDFQGNCNYHLFSGSYSAINIKKVACKDSQNIDPSLCPLPVINIDKNITETLNSHHDSPNSPPVIFIENDESVRKEPFIYHLQINESPPVICIEDEEPGISYSSFPGNMSNRINEDAALKESEIIEDAVLAETDDDGVSKTDICKTVTILETPDKTLDDEDSIILIEEDNASEESERTQNRGMQYLIDHNSSSAYQNNAVLGNTLKLTEEVQNFRNIVKDSCKDLEMMTRGSNFSFINVNPTHIIHVNNANTNEVETIPSFDENVNETNTDYEVNNQDLNCLSNDLYSINKKNNHASFASLIESNVLPPADEISNCFLKRKNFQEQHRNTAQRDVTVAPNELSSSISSPLLSSAKKHECSVLNYTQNASNYSWKFCDNGHLVREQTILVPSNSSNTENDSGIIREKIQFSPSYRHEFTEDSGVISMRNVLRCSSNLPQNNKNSDEKYISTSESEQNLFAHMLTPLTATNNQFSLNSTALKSVQNILNSNVEECTTSKSENSTDDKNEVLLSNTLLRNVSRTDKFDIRNVQGISTNSPRSKVIRLQRGSTFDKTEASEIECSSVKTKGSVKNVTSVVERNNFGVNENFGYKEHKKHQNLKDTNSESISGSVVKTESLSAFAFLKNTDEVKMEKIYSRRMENDKRYSVKHIETNNNQNTCCPEKCLAKKNIPVLSKLTKENLQNILKNASLVNKSNSSNIAMSQEVDEKNEILAMEHPNDLVIDFPHKRKLFNEYGVLNACENKDGLKSEIPNMSKSTDNCLQSEYNLTDVPEYSNSYYGAKIKCINTKYLTKSITPEKFSDESTYKEETSVPLLNLTNEILKDILKNASVVFPESLSNTLLSPENEENKSLANELTKRQQKSIFLENESFETSFDSSQNIKTHGVNVLNSHKSKEYLRSGVSNLSDYNISKHKDELIFKTNFNTEYPCLSEVTPSENTGSNKRNNTFCQSDDKNIETFSKRIKSLDSEIKCKTVQSGLLSDSDLSKSFDTSTISSQGSLVQPDDLYSCVSNSSNRYINMTKILSYPVDFSKVVDKLNIYIQNKYGVERNSEHNSSKNICLNDKSLLLDSIHLKSKQQAKPKKINKQNIFEVKKTFSRYSTSSDDSCHPQNYDLVDDKQNKCEYGLDCEKKYSVNSVNLLSKDHIYCSNFTGNDSSFLPCKSTTRNTGKIPITLVSPNISAILDNIIYTNDCLTQTTLTTQKNRPSHQRLKHILHWNSRDHSKQSFQSMEGPLTKSANRLPASNEVSFLITEWLPIWLEKQTKTINCPPVCGNNKMIKESYKNYREYTDTYCRLHLVNVWIKLFAAWMEKPTVFYALFESCEEKNLHFTSTCNALMLTTDIPVKQSVILVVYNTVNGIEKKMFGFIHEVRTKTVIRAMQETVSLKRVHFSFYTVEQLIVEISDKIKIHTLCNVRVELKQYSALKLIDSTLNKSAILNPNEKSHEIKIMTLPSRFRVETLEPYVHEILNCTISANKRFTLLIQESISENTLIIFMLVRQLISRGSTVLICLRDPTKCFNFAKILQHSFLLAVKECEVGGIPGDLQKFTLSSYATDMQEMNFEVAEMKVLKDIKIILTVTSCMYLSNCKQCALVPNLICIIDEAHQCTEAETALPLGYKPDNVILFGNPQKMIELHPYLQSQGYNKSLFHRLLEGKLNVKV